MNLAAPLCIHSSLSVSVLLLSHTMALISKVDLTSAKYACLRQFCGQCFRLRWRNPSVELVLLLSYLYEWSVHFRSIAKFRFFRTI